MCAADAKTEPLSANYRTVAVLMGPVSETAASDIVVVVVAAAAAAVRIPTTRGMKNRHDQNCRDPGKRSARPRPRVLLRSRPLAKVGFSASPERGINAEVPMAGAAAAADEGNHTLSPH